MRALPLLLLVSCAGAPHAFRVRFSDEDRTRPFPCETQDLYFDRKAEVGPTEKGSSPAGRTLVLREGKDTVIWLSHFEDDGESLKDDDYSYSIAIALRERRPGRFTFPSEQASLLFFSDNWGDRFSACEARAAGGWLEVDELGALGATGRFDVRLEGHRDVRSGGRKEVSIQLRGRFHTEE